MELFMAIKSFVILAHEENGKIPKTSAFKAGF